MRHRFTGANSMRPPADRIAQRISVEEWFARYDSADLLRAQGKQPRVLTPMRPPADRTAVRA